MAVTYGFFDALLDESTGTYDRTYSAEQMSMYFKGLVSDGIIANVGGMLQVTPKSGMQVQVATGRAILDSRWMNSDTVATLTISAAHATLPRIDTVVAVLEYSNRLIHFVVRKGTAASSPSAPAIRRNANYFELVLASIRIPAGASTITSAMITDRRPDQTVCGFVTGLVDQINTASMWEQLQADFTEWFENVKGQLSDDVAGNLQNQIDAHTDQLTAIETEQDTQDESLTAHAAAIATLTENQTPMKYSSFASTAATYVKSYSLQVYKVGRIVLINCLIDLTATAAPFDAVLATLPAALKPVLGWVMNGYITAGTNANEGRSILIDNDGKLKTRGPSNQKWPASTQFRFSGCYISAS